MSGNGLSRRSSSPSLMTQWLDQKKKLALQNSLTIAQFYKPSCEAGLLLFAGGFSVTHVRTPCYRHPQFSALYCRSNDKECLLNPFTRRAFLARAVAGAGASYVLASVPQLAEAHAYAAKQATSDSRSFHYFTPEQSSEVSAICEQILPSGDGPGAREAGVIFFIDYALSKFEMENRAAYVAGLEQLQLAAQKKEPAKKFSQVSSEQQIEVLKSIEKSDFFKLV